MEKLLSVFAVLFGIAAVAGFVLGVYWLIWLLWCWVLPQVWPTGPQGLVQPGFWLFAGAWFLLTLVGQAVFGRGGKSED